jgi:isocitrate dehydrogenase
MTHQAHLDADEKSKTQSISRDGREQADAFLNESGGVTVKVTSANSSTRLARLSIAEFVEFGAKVQQIYREIAEMKRTA